MSGLRRQLTLVTILGVLIAAGGCGSAATDGGASSASSSTPKEGAGTPSATGGAPSGSTTAADGDENDAQGRRLLVPLSAMPSGWRESSPPEPGFRTRICGVDTEPAQAAGQARQRLAGTALGPFLYQHVRVHKTAAVPQRVVAELKKALPTCTSFTLTGSGTTPEVTFTVSPLTVSALPATGVAWRMQPKGGPVQDLAFVPRGNSLVAFISTAARGNPDPKVLEAGLSALDGLS